MDGPAASNDIRTTNKTTYVVEKRQDLLSSGSLDIVVLELKIGQRQEKIYVLNIYNAPVGSVREGQAVRDILRKQSTLGGDFNLHHPDWEQRSTHSSPLAEEFAEWVSEQGGVYELAPGTVTHQQGGCIDLVVTSRSITRKMTECYINYDLDITSDHEVIGMTAELGDMGLDQERKSKFQLKKMDEKRFTETLLAEKDLIQAQLRLAGQEHPENILSRQKSLDKCAEAVTEAIFKGLELSTPEARNTGHGEPWWDENCKEAVRILKETRK